MSQRMKLFIFLLIINLIVVVFYLIWNYIRRKEKIGSVWMKAVNDAFMSGDRSCVCIPVIPAF